MNGTHMVPVCCSVRLRPPPPLLGNLLCVASEPLWCAGRTTTMRVLIIQPKRSPHPTPTPLCCPCSQQCLPFNAPVVRFPLRSW